MQQEELLIIIRRTISQETGMPLENVEVDTKLADLDVDSLDMLKLILVFEKSFDITISAAEIMCIKTIGDVIARIEQKVGS